VLRPLVAKGAFILRRALAADATDTNRRTRGLVRLSRRGHRCPWAEPQPAPEYHPLEQLVSIGLLFSMQVPTF
jgi:hypothetical protein